jgi:hypothetical protein
MGSEGMDYFVAIAHSVKSGSMSCSACNEELCVEGVGHSTTLASLQIETSDFLHFLEIPELNVVIGTSSR